MSTHLIAPEDEPAARLVVFSAALIAIAIRRATIDVTLTDVTGPEAKHTLAFDPIVITEAHMITDQVIQEAKRLQATEHTNVGG